jgi:hypothetical protein
MIQKIYPRLERHQRDEAGLESQGLESDHRLPALIHGAQGLTTNPRRNDDNRENHPRQSALHDCKPGAEREQPEQAGMLERIWKKTTAPDEYIQETEELLQKVVSGIGTQICESLRKTEIFD